MYLEHHFGGLGSRETPNGHTDAQMSVFNDSVRLRALGVLACATQLSRRPWLILVGWLRISAKVAAES